MGLLMAKELFKTRFGGKNYKIILCVICENFSEVWVSAMTGILLEAKKDSKLCESRAKLETLIRSKKLFSAQN